MEDLNQTNSVNEYDFSVDESTIETSKQDVQEPIQAQPSQPTTAQTSAQPQIPLDSAPFIVLCGPPSSGKSMEPQYLKISGLVQSNFYRIN